jgi:hypothetical protein
MPARTGVVNTTTQLRQPSVVCRMIRTRASRRSDDLLPNRELNQFRAGFDLQLLHDPVFVEGNGSAS